MRPQEALDLLCRDSARLQALEAVPGGRSRRLTAVRRLTECITVLADLHCAQEERAAVRHDPVALAPADAERFGTSEARKRAGQRRASALRAALAVGRRIRQA